MRMPVTVILDILAAGLSMEGTLEKYPSLQAEDVGAAIAYAADLARGRSLSPNKCSYMLAP